MLPSMAQQPAHRSVIRLSVQAQAVALFLKGFRPAEIAAKLNIGLTSVYCYIADVRSKILEEKRDYFDTKLSALLDEQLDTLISQTALLGDREFLKSLSAEQLRELSVTYGVLADKTFILLSAAQRFQTRQNPARALLGAADGASDTGDTGDAENG